MGRLGGVGDSEIRGPFVPLCPSRRRLLWRSAVQNSQESSPLVKNSSRIFSGFFTNLSRQLPTLFILREQRFARNKLRGISLLSIIPIIFPFFLFFLNLIIFSRLIPKLFVTTVSSLIIGGLIQKLLLSVIKHLFDKINW